MTPGDGEQDGKNGAVYMIPQSRALPSLWPTCPPLDWGREGNKISLVDTLYPGLFITAAYPVPGLMCPGYTLSHTHPCTRVHAHTHTDIGRTDTNVSKTTAFSSQGNVLYSLLFSPVLFYPSLFYSVPLFQKTGITITRIS